MVREQPQSTEPSASAGLTLETKNQDRLKLFLTVVMAEVLEKCNAFQNCSIEDCASLTKGLVTQAEEALAGIKAKNLQAKYSKKVRKAVIKDLLVRFGKRHLQESGIFLKDLVTKQTFVQFVITRIKEHVERLIEEEKTFRNVIQIMAFGAFVIVGAIILVMLM